MSKPTPNPAPPRRILFTPEQAAEYLQMSSGTLEKWRYQRRGPSFVKVGSLVRYELTALDAYIDAQTIHEIPEASGL
jgi:excisionase family DNA binding protein